MASDGISRPDWDSLYKGVVHLADVPGRDNELVQITRETARLAMNALREQNANDYYRNFGAAQDEICNVLADHPPSAELLRLADEISAGRRLCLTGDPEALGGASEIALPKHQKNAIVIALRMFAAPIDEVSLLAALYRIVDVGGSAAGEKVTTGDGHARCREIAQAAIAKANKAVWR